MQRDDGSETAAEAVVQVLEAWEVDVIFSLPGEENLPVVSALGASAIELVVCRHEQHAAFMAVAHARLTGTLGVCLATLGPGALNLFTGLAQAQLIGVPVLALTGQKALIDNREGPFQVVDVVGAARPIVHDARSVADPELAATIVDDAIRHAIANRTAALIELPEDVADAVVSPDARGTSGSDRRLPPVASPDAISALISEIERAERPVILAGQACANPFVADRLHERCRATGLSVLATQMGKGAVPESSRRSLRSLGMHRPDYAHLALERADLVVCVGYQPVEHPPLAWNPDEQCRIVHVHAQPARRAAGYEPVLEVVGDIRDSLDRIETAVATDWSDACRQAIEECLAVELDDLPANSVAAVPAVLAGALSDDHVIALDNGLYKLWFARHFPSAHPHALVLDNALATMGAGLASGMAAARLGRRSVVVTGDGGFLMNGAELETARRLGLDLTVLVLRDDEYGFIAWHQDEQDRDNLGVELTNPDLVAFAESFGVRGRRVTTGAELAGVLADPQPGVTLIDYPVNYTCNALLERDNLIELARARLQ